jgi:hypothetical protein
MRGRCVVSIVFLSTEWSQTGYHFLAHNAQCDLSFLAMALTRHAPSSWASNAQASVAEVERQRHHRELSAQVRGGRM